jgi:hypothetical protein
MSSELFKCLHSKEYTDEFIECVHLIDAMEKKLVEKIFVLNPHCCKTFALENNIIYT